MRRRQHTCCGANLDPWRRCTCNCLICQPLTAGEKAALCVPDLARSQARWAGLALRRVGYTPRPRRQALQSLAVVIAHHRTAMLAPHRRPMAFEAMHGGSSCRCVACERVRWDAAVHTQD